ncbi:PfkB family carbohydrate kinase [Terrabacter sp. NPDC080008]|uniref:PfkB family carbohydrate kinase n=1 Tax=Terrabacter sp. NPDC080008 TaxID=3155176 RepID=UPI00344DB5F5
MGRVVVLGSLNVDVVTLVERHPLPGETLLGEPGGTYAGGKGGNQALAARRAGADVVMVGSVGTDEAGDAYLARLRDAGVETAVTRVPGAPTGTAYITVDEAGENTIVVVPGANESVEDASLKVVGLGPGDVLLCSLEIPLDVVARAVLAADRAGARVVLNMAPYSRLLADAVAVCDPVVVNESEMRQLADSGLMPASLLVTFGAAGARWGIESVDGIPVAKRDLGDTVGAGDAFCGALAAALANGADDRSALVAANAAGAAAVRWVGAQPDARL